jgi:hypothetical protein
MGHSFSKYFRWYFLSKLFLFLVFLFITLACASNRFTQASKPPEPTETVLWTPTVTLTLTPSPTFTSSPLPTYEPTHFCLKEPGSASPFCYSAIEQPFKQVEFDVNFTEDRTLNFNLKDFNFNAGTNTCSLIQEKYEFDTLNDSPANLLALFPPVLSTINFDLTKAVCRAAKIATMIKANKGGTSCVEESRYISSSEKEDIHYIKMTTPASGDLAQYGLLEATLLQGTYNNIMPLTINLGADCRCWYNVRYGDENSVNIMALQEHCAAHFNDWHF